MRAQTKAIKSYSFQDMKASMYVMSLIHRNSEKLNFKFCSRTTACYNTTSHPRFASPGLKYEPYSLNSFRDMGVVGLKAFLRKSPRMC